MTIIASESPGSGGPAHVTTDDGFGRPDESAAGCWLTVPNAAYRPPDRRGGS